MSNLRPVERALSTLLPTHENEMPRELLNLAQSLFAQSRSYSSSLKPEEEIARPHACAEIACRRLARTLKLPPLLGHPPCPPRVYKKLYTFLDNSIGGGASAASKNKSAPVTPSKVTSTPRKSAGPNAGTSRTPSKQVVSSSQTFPAKRALGDQLNNTPSKATPIKRARFVREPLHLSQDIKDAPQFVMPAIRTVCQTLATPAPRMTLLSRPPISRTLPPHIFAGVSSILHFVAELSDDQLDELNEDCAEIVNVIRAPPKEEDFKEVVMALIVAVYFLVLARRRSSLGNTTSATQVPESTAAAGNETPKMDKKTFTEMRQTALSSLGFPSSEKQHGEDVDTWIELVQIQKWAKGREWFDNIPLAGERDDQDSAGLVDEDDGESDVEKNQGANNGSNAAGSRRRKTNIFSHVGADEEGLLLPGLGTMMQDRVDYLSEDRKEDFLEWKATILDRIDSIAMRRTATA